MPSTAADWTKTETWSYLAKRLQIEFGGDHVLLVAAGVGSLWLLALSPGLATEVSIWAIVADPAKLLDSLAPYLHLLPTEAGELIEARPERVIVLLLWFWLTAISIVFGAEVSSELERLQIHGIRDGDHPNKTGELAVGRRGPGSCRRWDDPKVSAIIRDRPS